LEIREYLLNFLDLNAASGNEAVVFDKVSTLLAPLGRVYSDHAGSIYCTVREDPGNKKHVVLDAHLDEVGFMVTAVTDDGFLKVTAVGGLDKRLIPGLEITVHGKEELFGIFTSIPPHLLKDEDRKKVTEIEDLAIDVGLSREEAVKLVSPGDTVTVLRKPAFLLNDCVSSKALDDRAGCAVIARAAELLKGKDLDCNITLLFSVQEEVGGLGARTGSFRLCPTSCIAVDVGHGYTPDAPRERCGDVGKGCQIGFAPILSRKITEDLLSLCIEKDIPFQYDIMGGKTGTNADGIVLTGEGVPCGLVSIPLKYMHTPVEVVSMKDCENIAQLLAAYVEKEGSGKNE